MPTLVTLFSGGGLCDIGYSAVGFTPIGAVEFEPSIAEWYVRNLGEHCVVACVSDVDYTRWAGADLLHVSPPCTNASVANQKAGEGAADLENADAVCRALREIGPRWFVCENVPGYAKFKSFGRIVACLRELGYALTWSVENSADYAVPQTRKRLFLRASRTGRVPKLTPTHCKSGRRGWDDAWLLKPWNGWYAAIEDLIPTLPDGKLAPWQLKRMPEWLTTCLVSTNSIDGAEPAFAATGEQNGRLRALISGEWDGPQREGLALRAFTEEEPSSAVMSSTHKRQPYAVLVGNQQGAATESGREPMMCQRDEPAHPVTASLHAKGKLPVGLLIGDQLRPVAAAERPAFTVRAGEHGGAEPKACLLDSGNTSREPTLISEDAPSMTVQAWHGRRPSQAPSILLGAARVVTITPRCLARFQSVPDTYELPDKNSLACRIIGNGVPCLVTQAIGEAFLRGDQ